MNKKNNKFDLKPVIGTLLFAAIYYYFMLPPLNLSSPFFWFSLVLIVIFYTMISGINNLASFVNFDNNTVFSKNFSYNTDKRMMIIGTGLISLVAILVVINFISAPIFNSKEYGNRISVNEELTFEENVLPVDFKNLALLDKASSQKLGDRVMGQIPELVSQFNVSSIYTQISYKGIIERVTPLEYADVFKYFTNRKKGVAGYIKVNSVTGEATLEKMKKGMKYVPSALFGEDLHRKLRMSYVKDIFGEPAFEVDDENNPYWIVPVLKYKAVGLKEEIESIIILNPVDGTSNKYNVKDVPTWVDHVYKPELVIEQVNDWGKYKKGFLNSIIGQKEVVATTEGYNYLIMNGDVYMTTGITSASLDESNLGFIFTNLRTKETNFYAVPGAEEFSAMDSAMGQVQQMNYIATFPIIINLNTKPTYLISLKDNAGLVKMYAFVDSTDYQKVTVTDSSKGIEKAAKNYLGDSIDQTKNKVEKTITVKTITNINVDGTTYFYITDVNNAKYKANIKTGENIFPFTKKDDKLTVVYHEQEINEIITIK